MWARTSSGSTSEILRLLWLRQHGSGRIPVGARVVDSAATKQLENCRYWSILVVMAENLLEFAQKMARAARAGLAVERKRLKEILAERQRKQPVQPSQQSR